MNLNYYGMKEMRNSERTQNKIKHHPEKWRSHVNRMNSGRFPTAILGYRSMGQRSTGRPIKK
jgi:hypothetical protein